MFFETQDQPWEIIDDKIERQIVGYDDSLMMVIVRFKKDGIGYLHQHIHSQATYIAEGKFEVKIAGESKILKKGDSFFIPTNAEHGVVCLEDGILIDAFSPVRKDFL